MGVIGAFRCHALAWPEIAAFFSALKMTSSPRVTTANDQPARTMAPLDHTLIPATAQVVAGYLQKNTVPADGLPVLIRLVHQALAQAAGSPLAGLAAPHAMDAAQPAPLAAADTAQPDAPRATPKRTIYPDYIICLEDGRKLKTLKRHLRSAFALSPEQYREKWGLPADYPMVAPNYAEKRSALARDLGLGKRGRAAAAAKPEVRLELSDEEARIEAAVQAARGDGAADHVLGAAPATEDSAPGHAPSLAKVFARFPQPGQQPVADNDEAPVAADVFGDARPEEEPDPAPGEGGRRKRVPFARQFARAMRK